MNTTPEDTELRDEITGIIYGADWKSRSIAKSHKPDVEAAMEVITLHTQKAERKGHWYTHEKKLDVYWNSAYYYYCNCGYRSSTREGVDGHVQWKLAQLTNPTEAGEE